MALSHRLLLEDALTCEMHYISSVGQQNQGLGT